MRVRLRRRLRAQLTQLTCRLICAARLRRRRWRRRLAKGGVASRNSPLALLPAACCLLEGGVASHPAPSAARVSDARAAAAAAAAAAVAVGGGGGAPMLLSRDGCGRGWRRSGGEARHRCFSGGRWLEEPLVPPRPVRSGAPPGHVAACHVRVGRVRHRPIRWRRCAASRSAASATRTRGVMSGVMSRCMSR